MKMAANEIMKKMKMKESNNENEEIIIMKIIMKIMKSNMKIM